MYVAPYGANSPLPIGIMIMLTHSLRVCLSMRGGEVSRHVTIDFGE